MAIPYLPSQETTGKILDYYSHCLKAMQGNWNLRPMLEEMDKAYARHQDKTTEQRKAQAANKAGDVNKFQNIVLPVIMPQVEQCLAYQQSVFLTGSPIFSCVSIPEFAEAASQMDTIFAEHQRHGNWPTHLLKAMRDGLKYNLMAVEADWHTEKVAVSVADPTARNTSDNATEIAWEGNRIRHLNLYNTFWDTRVAPADVARMGEYAGYHQLLGRVAFKKFVSDMPTKINAAEAFRAGTNANLGGVDYDGYYFPKIKPSCFVEEDAKSFDWGAWAGYKGASPTQEYKDSYLVTTLYARIIPNDFGMSRMPAPNTPQVWKFIIVNGSSILFAERMGHHHNLLPIIIAQVLDDGLGYQTNSFAENLLPFQAITTALANSSIAARRRAISGRTLYDPSKISGAVLNNDNPVANMPVRPSAYGRPLGEAVYPFPFQDDQFQINMMEIQSYTAMANTVSGLNPARQGQFVKGNKTKFEYADVMANANGRDQAISLMLEGNFFTPLKELLKYNVLQYQKPGTLVRPDTGQPVTIEPVALQKAALVLSVTDGLTPSDKIIDGDTLSSAVQMFSSMPQLGQEYNLGDMVAHLFSSRGLKLAAYKKSPQQVAYEQAVGAWQQSMQQIAMALEKGQIAPEQMQQVMASLPQPTPEQFGYVPGTKQLTPGAATTPNSPSIVGNIGQIIQQATQSAEQASGQSAAAQGTEQ